MAEFPFFRESVARKIEPKGPAAVSSPAGQPNLPASKYCAYNQTRKRFLCADVQAADSSLARFDALLPALTPGCGAALWIVPIRIISPTSVRVPLDLVYLDRNGTVLDTVESFPISPAPASSSSAASILALPAQTIASTGTQPGDRLILCAPEEMKRRLQQLPDAKADTRIEQDFPSSPSDASGDDRLTPRATGNLLAWVDRSSPKPSIENSPTETAPLATPTPPEPERVQPAPWKTTTAKNWLQRLLSPDPPDPRKAPREALSWLVAYFFTGGNSVAHGIRDISATGLYVFTDERWYLGTVVRITLTDRREPTPERSFTVNAKAVRSGDDGVGFHFVLNGEKELRRGAAPAVDGLAGGVNREQVEQFLQIVKGRAT